MKVGILSTPEPRLRLYVRRERSVPLTEHFTVDYRIFWIAVVIGVCVVFDIAAYRVGVLIMGLIFDVLMIMAYGLLIAFPLFDGFKSTGLSKGFRSGNHLLRQFLGHNKHSSNQPTTGEIIGVEVDPKKRPRPKPIKRIGRIDFQAHETGNGKLGISWDHPYNTHSVTLWNAGSSLLSDSSQQMLNRLNGFAQILDQMAEADSRIHRFSWREQTLLGEQQHPEQIVRTIREGAQLKQPSYPNDAVLMERTAEMGADSVQHRTTLTLTVYDPSVKQQVKDEGSVENVVTQIGKDFYGAITGSSEGGLSPIGLKAARFLTYNELILENRLALDPVFAQPYWQEWPGPEDDTDMLSEHDAWPKYINFEPYDHCVLGETYHMGFYLEELPRQGMLPDQFWSILKLRIPKTVTTVYEMVPNKTAERIAQWSSNAAGGINVDAVKAGRPVSEAKLRSARVAKEHESEIADYAGQVGRIRCYIDLTGETLEEVKASAQILRGAARDARFVVEPLVGRQHLGIEAVMPIGRGLAGLSLSDYLG